MKTTVDTVKPMTSGPIWKAMTVFALPVFLGAFFQQMYNTVDSIIVGRFLGENALAAVTSSGNLIFMLIGFFSGVAVGAGVIIAQFFGARDEKKVRITVHTTICLGLIVGVIMTVVGVALSPQILVWMKTPDSVMGDSVTYLRIYFSGTLFFVMYNFFVGILQAVGDSKHPLYYLIISSVINLILDIVFIGFFHTGVGGAALATIISQFISCILCLIPLMRTNDCYKFRFKWLKINLPVLKKIISLGFPSGVQNCIIGFANVVVQSHINHFGNLAMAGYGAYSKIEGFAFLPITAFTQAITTFVGQNLGARELERTKKGARFGVIVTLVLSELIGILTFIFARPLMQIFDDNPAVIQFGVDKARTAALFYCMLAYSHASSAVLRGAGKAWVPMIVMVSIWCVFRVLFLTITIALTNSITMVYIVYPLTWTMSSIFFFFYQKKVNWLK